MCRETKKRSAKGRKMEKYQPACDADFYYPSYYVFTTGEEVVRLLKSEYNWHILHHRVLMNGRNILVIPKNVRMTYDCQCREMNLWPCSCYVLNHALIISSVSVFVLDHRFPFPVQVISTFTRLPFVKYSMCLCGKFQMSKASHKKV